MRNYQRKRNNPYRLPDDLYKRMKYLIRDCRRMKKERSDILFSSPSSDGTPHSGIGNPTEHKALKLVVIDRECEAYDRALKVVPEEYRKGVLDSICRDAPYPYDAHRNTYWYWKSKLVYTLAEILHYI